MIKFGKIDLPIEVGPEENSKILDKTNKEYEEIAKNRKKNFRVTVAVSVNIGGGSVEIKIPVKASVGGDVDDVLINLIEIGYLSRDEAYSLSDDAHTLYSQSAIDIKDRIRNKYYEKHIKHVKTERMKEGLEYAMDPDNDISMFKFPFFRVGIGVQRINVLNHRVSVCFCVPQDEWSNRRAVELLGYRLKHSPIIDMSYDKLILSRAEVAERAIHILIMKAKGVDRGFSLPQFFLENSSFRLPSMFAMIPMIPMRINKRISTSLLNNGEK